MYGTKAFIVRQIYMLLATKGTIIRQIKKMINKTMLNRQLCLCDSFPLLRIMPVLLILLYGCGGGLKLTSDWQQGEMNIEGSDSEWQRGLYYDKESDMVYSVRNNDKYVYVFMKTQNRSTQMQIMRQGLTVWFDREDKNNQTFGIQYPISRQETHAGFSPDTNEEKLHTFLDQEFPEMEIIGPKKENIQRFSALETPGIRVKLSRSHETLVYELRVPLNKTSEYPFAIEPVSEHRIGIEFETGEFKQEQNKSGMHVGSGHDHSEGMGENNPAEEGSIGGGRRSSGSGHQGGRFGNLEKTKQMELWLSVQLAKSTS